MVQEGQDSVATATAAAANMTPTGDKQTVDKEAVLREKLKARRLEQKKQQEENVHFYQKLIRINKNY